MNNFFFLFFLAVFKKEKFSSVLGDFEAKGPLRPFLKYFYL